MRMSSCMLAAKVRHPLQDGVWPLTIFGWSGPRYVQHLQLTAELLGLLFAQGLAIQICCESFAFKRTPQDPSAFLSLSLEHKHRGAYIPASRQLSLHDGCSASGASTIYSARSPFPLKGMPHLYTQMQAPRSDINCITSSLTVKWRLLTA